MKFYLTRQHFISLFKEKVTTDGNRLPERIKYWNQNYKPKFNLEYDELNDEESPGFYGVVFGDEKDISWFLLQL